MSEFNPKQLLIEVLTWFANNQYRRASFERLTSVIPSASTFGQLYDMVQANRTIFRPINLRGGNEGLALVDGILANRELAKLTTIEPPMTTEEIEDTPVTGNAPKITSVDVQNEIASEYFLNVGEAIHATDLQAGRLTQVLPQSLGMLTICILVLKNGYTVTGKSACVSPENFNGMVGRTVAKKHAVDKIWPLLGFRLADTLNQKTEPAVLLQQQESNIPPVAEVTASPTYPEGILRNVEVPVQERCVVEAAPGYPVAHHQV